MRRVIFLWKSKYLEAELLKSPSGLFCIEIQRVKTCNVRKSLFHRKMPTFYFYGVSLYLLRRNFS